MPTNETLYTNEVFQAAALPLLKVIATDVPSLHKQFKGVDAIYQVSAMADGEKHAVHFHGENGEWTKVYLETYSGDGKIDAELAFSAMEKMSWNFLLSLSGRILANVSAILAFSSSV